jgi:3-deoxy-D-manno-octulosonic-acid transferase
VSAVLRLAGVRLIYSLAWWCALPLVLLRLLLRARGEPGYRQHIGERLGFYPRRIQQPALLLWVHAVSVGETRAAQPVIQALLATSPLVHILLTHMTPTGRETGRQLFGDEARVTQCYFPYDTGWMSGRFVRHFTPRLCVLMETEVWPNAMAQCARHRIPVALINARLSARSLARAQRFPALFMQAASAITCVAAQTEGDAQRIRSMGAPDVHVTGSVKFDILPPPDMLQRGVALRQQFGTRPALLCANTREGEEALILDAFCALADRRFLLVMVPRHPQRFAEVADAIHQRGLHYVRRSMLGAGAIGEDVDVVLGDTMGEMFAYYAASDVAFVGGNLLPFGGHNLIEACAVGKPVLIGPHTFNFADAAENAVATGAATRVTDASDLLRHAMHLLSDTEARDAMGRKAQLFAAAHRGATQRTLALLQPLIDPPTPKKTPTR